MKIKNNKIKRLCADCGSSCSLRHLHLVTSKELCDKCYIKTKTKIPKLDKIIKDVTMTFSEYEMDLITKKITEMFGKDKQGFAKYIKYLIEQDVDYSKPIVDDLRVETNKTIKMYQKRYAV